MAIAISTSTVFPERYRGIPPDQGFHGWRLVTPPIVEPLEVEEVRQHCEIDHDERDPLIEGLIIAAREYVERASGEAMRPQEWRLSLLQFPACNFIEALKRPFISVREFAYMDSDGVRTVLSENVDYMIDRETPLPRVVLPFNGIWPPVTLATNAPVQITFRLGYPIVRGDATVNGQTVTRVKGDPYTDVPDGDACVIDGRNHLIASVDTADSLTLATPYVGPQSMPVEFIYDPMPRKFKQTMLLLCGHWFENREATGERPSGAIAFAVEALLADRIHHF